MQHRRKRRRLGCLVLTVAIVAMFTVSSVVKDALQHFASPYNSESVFVYNLSDQVEVINIQGDKKRAPASLVKIATVYASLQHLEDLSVSAPVDQASYELAVRNDLAMAGFVPGERTTYRDLLYGTILASGGEAANALATNVAGSSELLVPDMNRLAKELGLRNTRFTNVEGRDEFGQWMSARDIAYLTEATLQNGHFRVLFTTSTFTTSNTSVHPSGIRLEHSVLSKVNLAPGSDFRILGGKSGTTKKAGLCWVVLAEKAGKQYVIVTMGCPYDDINNPGDGHIQDTLRILRDL